MKNKESNRSWELSVKKVNNSLNEAEKKEFEKIEGSEETQKALLQANKFILKSPTAILFEK